MCGIIGVLGRVEAAPRILDALKRLEYRGYDSAGLTVLKDGSAIRRRTVGKLGALVSEVAEAPAPGTAGIGHTRWATHGAPNIANAHPHASGPVHVVHNGIIENFRELRAELTDQGANLATETDSEVVPHLIARALRGGKAPKDALEETLGRIEGAFALAILIEGEEDLLLAARHGSPLAIGHGEGEMFVGSDALALSPLTSEITYLEEGDYAVITRAGAEIYAADGSPAPRKRREVPMESALVDKGGYRHFMAKEIHEQPTVLGYVMSRYVAAGRERIASPAEEMDFARVSRAFMVGCGTASFAGMVGKYWFEQLAGLPVELDIASEFRYRQPPIRGDEAAFFISQSGETADTLAALRDVAGRVAKTAAVLNVLESSIGREADVILPTIAGREIGVASTKAFTCQLAVLATTALIAARQRGMLEPAREAALIAALGELPRLAGEILEREHEIDDVAHAISTASDVLYIGRGPMYPMALEGALKLKEISYIHAEAYAAGELKHGAIALVDESLPVVVMAPRAQSRDGLFEKTVSNMQEVMARGGRVVLISDAQGIAEGGQGVWRTVEMPVCDPFVAPILYAVPAQLIAYHAARAKGTDVDQPRNLAKSVTVE